MPSRLELRIRHRALVFHYTDRHAPKGPSQLIGTWAKGFVTLLPPSTTTILSPPSSLLFFGEEAIYSKMMMTGKYSISFLFKEKWKKKTNKTNLGKEKRRGTSHPITSLLLLVYITYDGGAHHLAIIWTAVPLLPLLLLPLLPRTTDCHCCSLLLRCSCECLWIKFLPWWIFMLIHGGHVLILFLSLCWLNY